VSGRRESNPHGQLGSSVLHLWADLRAWRPAARRLHRHRSPPFPDSTFPIWHGSGTWGGVCHRGDLRAASGNRTPDLLSSGERLTDAALCGFGVAPVSLASVMGPAVAPVAQSGRCRPGPVTTTQTTIPPSFPDSVGQEWDRSISGLVESATNNQLHHPAFLPCSPAAAALLVVLDERVQSVGCFSSVQLRH
jgi:hypothetical protein